uniref:mitogen-activated protein kinase kinase n=1 Tax=Toxocara canis TaxID=6265 RepID=A0A183V753_TOXCA
MVGRTDHYGRSQIALVDDSFVVRAVAITLLPFEYHVCRTLITYPVVVYERVGQLLVAASSERGVCRTGKGKLGRLTMPKPESPPNLDLDDKCMMKFDDQGNEIEVRAQDLEKLEELGRGAYGVVEKMRHRETNIIMAVKRIHSSINDESQKRMLIELQACMKSDCCPQGDVWICMEVMDTSLDKFYRMTIDSGRRLPEMFIAKCALAVVEGLNFMKEQMNLIHRDVKPSNILLNKQGAVKICDFGISGHLTNSVAKTVNAGCKPYMPPERIEGEKKVAYDVRADVWSLGITLVTFSLLFIIIENFVGV